MYYVKKLSFMALLAIGCLAQAIPLTLKTALIIEQGDITGCKVAAIVNAANNQLAGGAGVCGAIFKAAGWQALQNACNKNPLIGNVRCPVGHARITPSFMLEKNGINHIIHAVGPDCRIIKDPAQQDALLYSAYTESLKIADAHGITSIAFPFISSAIYAFPPERAARIAVQAIKEYVVNHEKTTTLTRIHCVLFSQKDLDLFLNTMHSI